MGGEMLYSRAVCKGGGAADAAGCEKRLRRSAQGAADRYRLSAIRWLIRQNAYHTI